MIAFAACLLPDSIFVSSRYFKQLHFQAVSESSMHNRGNNNQVPKVSVIGKAHQQAAAQASDRQKCKRLGDYLIEAGLLTKAQIDVALNDQQMTAMKFGEILAARGWVKQQTIEFLMTKVVLPERRHLEQRARQRQAESAQAPVQIQAPTESSHLEPNRPAQNGQAFVRKEVPISKPLPSVKSTDGDVNWVG
jgi:hypothetical protein